MYDLTEWLLISCVYGADRYAAGLRIAHKSFLTDGRELALNFKFIHTAGTLLLTVAVLGLYLYIACKLRLVRSGDWNDPTPT